MPEQLIAFVTCPVSFGQKLASVLVNESLAACVNLVPGIQSIYRWQEEIHCDAEELLIAKTDRAVWEQFQARVKELHPYELPEIIGIPIACGYEPYLNWIESSVHREKSRLLRKDQ